jgi:hypothetical protein
MTEAERDARAAKRKADMREGEFQAEVDRQHEIERKRLRLDPVTQPGLDRALRNRVERSVRVQWRDPLKSPGTRVELEEAIERRLPEKGFKTSESRTTLLAEDARLRKLYSRSGSELPGEAKTRGANVSYKVQSAVPVRVGAGRSRIPVARVEAGSSVPVYTRQAEEAESDKWLERVERAAPAYETNPAAPKRIIVDSRRYSIDPDYRKSMQREAKADAETRLRKTRFPTETQLVNEHGRPLIKFRPSMELMQQVLKEGAK